MPSQVQAYQDAARNEVDRAHDSVSEVSLLLDCSWTIRELNLTEAELKILGEVTFAKFRQISDLRKDKNAARNFRADDLIKELTAELEKILDRDRMVRQQQLSACYEFRNRGFVAAIARFATTKFDMKGRALSRHQSVSQKIAGELSGKVEALRQECLVDLTNTLTHAQRERMTDCRIDGLRNRRNPGTLSPNDVLEETAPEVLRSLTRNTNQLDASQVEKPESLESARQQFLRNEDDKIRERRVEFGRKVMQQVETMLAPDRITYFKLVASREMLDTGGFVACCQAEEPGTFLGVTEDQKKLLEKRRQSSGPKRSIRTRLTGKKMHCSV